MDADHQKSAFASKRGVPKCPFGELYVLHFQTDDFFKTKSCGKQEKFIYTNAVPAAKGIKISSNVRKVGGHVTALDISIDAEPGEYAFVIRNPEAEETLKQASQDFDMSILTQGAFFFTVK